MLCFIVNWLIKVSSLNWYISFSGVAQQIGDIISILCDKPQIRDLLVNYDSKLCLIRAAAYLEFAKHYAPLSPPPEISPQNKSCSAAPPTPSPLSPASTLRLKKNKGKGKAQSPITISSDPSPQQNMEVDQAILDAQFEANVAVAIALGKDEQLGIPPHASGPSKTIDGWVIAKNRGKRTPRHKPGPDRAPPKGDGIPGPQKPPPPPQVNQPRSNAPSLKSLAPKPLYVLITKIPTPTPMNMVDNFVSFTNFQKMYPNKPPGELVTMLINGGFIKSPTQPSTERGPRCTIPSAWSPSPPPATPQRYCPSPNAPSVTQGPSHLCPFVVDTCLFNKLGFFFFLKKGPSCKNVIIPFNDNFIPKYIIPNALPTIIHKINYSLTYVKLNLRVNSTSKSHKSLWLVCNGMASESDLSHIKIWLKKAVPSISDDAFNSLTPHLPQSKSFIKLYNMLFYKPDETLYIDKDLCSTLYSSPHSETLQFLIQTPRFMCVTNKSDTANLYLDLWDSLTPFQRFTEHASPLYLTWALPSNIQRMKSSTSQTVPGLN
ncbi:hypothetical protein P691DRAFT_767026 [Macrolepiota fuliginosa MF-IS2]|uniref:Uncharacterized protein n=1 Tax=Macrolepiota fuliginosa MF-IS2 TaxID=1400762 RepID=A0A9P5X043_9AGAR|nr:hypothetical protein P691DRAFT_767026 [Macrolepiota fuliginosa MF-IS2]